jgi:hypothetical protein
MSPSVAAISIEPSVAPTTSLERVEHHATPAGAAQAARANVVASRSPEEGAVLQTPLVRYRQPGRPSASAVRGADAIRRGGGEWRTATRSSSREDVLIAAVLVMAALAAALAIWRRRRRPNATPADPEAPRMMVLVGGLQHEADARRIDRPMPTQHDERLAA